MISFVEPISVTRLGQIKVQHNQIDDTRIYYFKMILEFFCRRKEHHHQLYLPCNDSENAKNLNAKLRLVFLEEES